MGLVKQFHKGPCVNGRLEPVLHCDDLSTRKKTHARHALLQHISASGSAHNEASTGTNWSFESESGIHRHRHLSRQVAL